MIIKNGKLITWETENQILEGAELLVVAANWVGGKGVVVSEKMTTFASGKTKLIQRTTQIHDDFCIPSEKCWSCNIKDLTEKMTTFVYF